MDKQIWCVAYTFYNHWVVNNVFFETYEEAKESYDRLLASKEISENTHEIESYMLKGKDANYD